MWHSYIAYEGTVPAGGKSMKRDELIEYLPKFMEKHHLIQQDIADQVGICRQRVSDWIRGKKKPSYIHYEKLLEYVEEMDNGIKNNSEE